MAIFFVCGCGQDLRADEESAGGVTFCPACGSRVPVPSLELANQRLGITTVPPMELIIKPRSDWDTPPETAADAFASQLVPSDTAVEQPGGDDGNAIFRLLDEPEDSPAQQTQKELKRQAVERILAEAQRELASRQESDRGTWRREHHWYECLLYPLRALPLLILCLSAVWAILTTLLLMSWPESWEPAELWTFFPMLLFPFLLLGYTLACCRYVFASGAAAEAGFIGWPARSDLNQAARSGVMGMWCFLVFPIVPAAAAFFFWLNSGDLGVVDRLILWELGIVTVGYWTLAMLAVHRSNRFRNALPRAVGRLCQRLGYRAAPVVLLAAVMVGHGQLALRAVEALHRSPAGWFALTACWASGLYWTFFLLRWLGISCFHSRPKKLRLPST